MPGDPGPRWRIEWEANELSSLFSKALRLMVLARWSACPATGLTGLVLAERAPLGAPSQGATQATGQLLEITQKVTHEAVGLPH